MSNSRNINPTQPMAYAELMAVSHFSFQMGASSPEELVQRAHAIKAGGWAVEGTDVQQRLSFERLYKWLEQQHSRRDRHDLRDPVTKKLVHRYVLPFKKMIVPPVANNLFKYRKGAQRLSDWITGGSSDGQAVGLAQGIIDMQLPALVAPPPGQAAREARASAAWARATAAAQRRSRLPLRSVQGDSADAQETRVVVSAVMRAAGAGSSSDDSDDEMAGQLEREMEEEDEVRGGAGPSRGGGGMPLEDIRRSLMEDSDDAEADGGAGQAVERQDSGSGGGAGGASSGGDGLSDYEKERQENIRRNQARLRELGLDGPIVPPPAPRQPRPPRPPGVPSRASGRQRDNAPKSYSERQADEDFEAQLASRLRRVSESVF